MTPRIMHKASKQALTSDLNNFDIMTSLEPVFRKNSEISEEKALFFIQSATQALEIMALALDLKKGDEIIMPSYTYAATANAFVRTGAVPVFADVDISTMNITSETVRPLITKRTKAIIPIHYGGIAADIKGLKNICQETGCMLLEDAAHGLGASYAGKPLGTIGELGCLSFHHTKNLTAAGNGGVLILDRNHIYYSAVEEIIHQGTNRLSFLRGDTTEYKWQRIGGEFSMPSFNMAYLENASIDLSIVTQKRRQLWERYQAMFSEHLETFIFEGNIVLPKLIEDAETNGHIYYLIMQNRAERDALKQKLNTLGIESYSHYEPLHRSKAGLRYGQARSKMSATEKAEEGLLRLPIYYDLTFDEQEYIIEAVINHIKQY